MRRTVPLEKIHVNTVENVQIVVLQATPVSMGQIMYALYMNVVAKEQIVGAHALLVVVGAAKITLQNMPGRLVQVTVKELNVGSANLVVALAFQINIIGIHGIIQMILRL